MEQFFGPFSMNDVWSAPLISNFCFVLFFLRLCNLSFRKTLVLIPDIVKE